MEAAGIMDELPSLAIRGICDYCDSHKNKQWQGHAALTAAAYAKTLLSVVPTTLSRKRDLRNAEKECLRSLSFREQEYRCRDIHSAINTCTWLFEDPQYKAWLNSRQGLLWIKGNPGTGKSVLIKFAVRSMADRNIGQLVSFFVHEGERQQMAKLFQWVLFAERPLSAHELRDALSIDKDMESGTQLRSQSSWPDTVAIFEVHVRHLSKGLVEFQTREIWEQYEPGEEDSDREAKFIHQSVADFLLNFLGRVMFDRHPSQSVVGDGHFYISRACLRYITLDEVLEGAQRLSRSKLFQRFQLIPYAVRFLFQHIKEVERQNVPQSDLLSLVYWDQKEKLQKIARLWRVSDPDNVYTPRGWPFIQATAFHVLITFASKSAFDDLLQKDDVEVDGRDIDGNTPLLLAIKEGRQDMAVALLNRSMEWQLQQRMAAGDVIACGISTKRERCYFVNVNAQDNDNNTPLSVAIEESALDVMLKLIEAGADPNTPDSYGRTPLSWAWEKEHKAVVRLLLERGANPNTQDSSGRTPLSWAWEKEHKVVVRLLLERGTNPNIQHSSGWTPLSWASWRGHEAVVKLLLECGADPNTKDSSGRTALSWASGRGHEAVAKLLLECGANPNIQDSSGWIPLSWASEGGHEAVVKLLLECGANPNTQDSSGRMLFLEWSRKRNN